MSYRLADWAVDGEAIKAAVAELELNAPHYGYSQQPSVRKTLKYIKHHIDCRWAFVVDEAYLLLVGHGEAWHGDDSVLEERLVLKLHAGNILLVPKALEDIARGSGYTAVLASDSSINFRMGAVYQRAGFKPITHTYYKELPWDNGSQS